MVPGAAGPGRALPHVEPAQGAALRALPAGRAAPQAPGPHGGPHPPPARLRPLPPHPQRRPGPRAPGEGGESRGVWPGRGGSGRRRALRTNPLSSLAVVDIPASILSPPPPGRGATLPGHRAPAARAPIAEPGEPGAGGVSCCFLICLCGRGLLSSRVRAAVKGFRTSSCCCFPGSVWYLTLMLPDSPVRRREVRGSQPSVRALLSGGECGNRRCV